MRKIILLLVILFSGFLADGEQKQVMPDVQVVQEMRFIMEAMREMEDQNLTQKTKSGYLFENDDGFVPAVHFEKK